MASVGRVDLRHLIDEKVHWQGSRPTCVPFAASAAHEAARTTAGNSVLALAPEAIWAHATCRGRTTANGMDPIDVDLALRMEGQPHLLEWPYNPHLGPEKADVRPTTLASPPWFRAQTETIPLALDGIEQPLEDALGAGHVVLLVLEVTDSFEQPAGGIVDLRGADKAHGRHAVVCVGAATHPIKGRCLLIKNSWGEWWGRGGYAWVTLEYLSRFGSEALIILV